MIPYPNVQEAERVQNSNPYYWMWGGTLLRHLIYRYRAHVIGSKSVAFRAIQSSIRSDCRGNWASMPGDASNFSVIRWVCSRVCFHYYKRPSIHGDCGSKQTHFLELTILPGPKIC